MARLIVEEGGQRRGFRLGDGVLTIGSGADARLRVSAIDVAEIHAELTVSGARVVLRARPGVVPPTVGGEPVLGEAQVGYGEEIRVGSVRLWLEDEAQPAGAHAPPPAAATATPSSAAGVAASAVERTVRRERAIAEAKRRGEKSVVQHTRRTVRRGPPAALVIPLVLLALVAVFLIANRMFRRDAERAVRVPALLESIERHVAEGAFDLALQRLDTLPPDLSAEERARVEGLRATIADRRAETKVTLEQSVGTQYLDVKLKRYEAQYLQGTPVAPRIREFLERCATFLSRWPSHPEREWVERQRKRFAGSVDLTQPPTLDDVEWKIECLTRTNPKDYKNAIQALDAFAETAAPDDADAAGEMRAQLVEERKANHLDRMQQAKYEYERKNDVTKAVAELVDEIVYNGDPEMTDEAVTVLLKLPDVDAHLRGYKVYRPNLYAEMVQHPWIAKRVEDLGL